MVRCGSRYSGNNDQIQGNTAVVNPGDDLQASYDRLKSSANDGAMGAISVTNQRYLILSPGTYTDNLTMDTDYVNVVGFGNALINMEGTITNPAKAYVNFNDYDPYTAKTWLPKNDYQANNIIFEDNFEDVTNWNVITGTIEDATDHYTFGTGSMKVTGQASQDSPIHIYSDAFTAIDVTTATVKVKYWVESRAGLFQDDADNAMTMSLTNGTAGQNANACFVLRMPAREGMWHEVEFTMAEVFETGTFDKTQVTGLWFKNDATVGKEGGCIIHIDRVVIYQNDTSLGKARILIGLDDGHISQYEALKYSALKGIRAYCCVASQLIGTANYMTWDQIKELYDTGLVNIHVHYDFPRYESGNTAMRWYALKSKIDLINQGISDADASVFVMPSGTDGLDGARPVPDDILELRKYFTYIRGTGPNWTGCGDSLEAGQPALAPGENREFEMGDLRTRAHLSPNRTQRWWTYGRNMGDGGEVADHDLIATWIAASKANGSILTLYAHIEVTSDITLVDWKEVIDAIRTAVDAGDAEVVSHNDI